MYNEISCHKLFPTLCRKLVLDTANCTRAEHLTSEEINRRIIYGADAEHLSESREEE